MAMDQSAIFSPQSVNALDLVAKNVFDEFDKDKSGKISAQELGSAVRMLRLNPTMKELQNVIKKIDRNGNGTIEYDEFLAFLKRSYKEKGEDSKAKITLSDYVSSQSTNALVMEAKSAFDKIDQDKNGEISVHELGTALRMLGLNPTREEVQSIIIGMNKKGDGLIKFDEFLGFLRRSHRNLDEDSSMSMDLSDICSSKNAKALVVEAQGVFREFDKDKNGFISAQELGTALRMLGLNPTMKEVQNMINEIDQNGDGMIDFDEFLAFLKRSYKKPDEVKMELKKAFQVFDLNKDGFISRAELQSVLTKMGEKLTEKEVDEMMEKADKNGDGKIDYDEYVDTMYPKG